MVIAENLHKIYTIKSKNIFSKKNIKEVYAVRNLSLRINEGEIVGLLGINGAGKTTIIKMLTTLLEPTKGQILIDGIDVIKNPQEVRKMINIITGGERNLYWRLTAKENLQYFASLYDIPDKEAKIIIDDLIDKVGLKEYIDIPVERFSKGMKQRLQFARGLINNPKYIFLDEPTLGLDFDVAKNLREYIKLLSKDENKGIIITSHYIKEIEELCDRVYIIDKGALLLEGKPAELIKKINKKIEINFNVDSLSKKCQKELADFANTQNYELSLNDVNNNTEIRIRCKENISLRIIELLNKNKVNIFSYNIVEPALEDVLIDLIK